MTSGLGSMACTFPGWDPCCCGGNCCRDAMVSSRRAAPAPAPGPDEEEVKKNAKGKKLMAEDEAYLRIQLEEIVVVKNEDVTRLAAARGSSYLGGAASRSCAPARPRWRGLRMHPR